MLAVTPLERILVETDSPYMAPEPCRGKRNDSSLLVYVLEKIAALKGVSAEGAHHAGKRLPPFSVSKKNCRRRIAPPAADCFINLCTFSG